MKLRAISLFICFGLVLPLRSVYALEIDQVLYVDSTLADVSGPSDQDFSGTYFCRLVADEADIGTTETEALLWTISSASQSFSVENGDEYSGSFIGDVFFALESSPWSELGTSGVFKLYADELNASFSAGVCRQNISDKNRLLLRDGLGWFAKRPCRPGTPSSFVASSCV